jgi:hypothetical protein
LGEGGFWFQWLPPSIIILQILCNHHESAFFLPHNGHG